MTNKELINNAVERINKKIAPKKLAYDIIPRGRQFTIDDKFLVTIPSSKEVLSYLDGFETALEVTNKK